MNARPICQDIDARPTRIPTTRPSQKCQLCIAPPVVEPNPENFVVESPSKNANEKPHGNRENASDESEDERARHAVSRSRK